MEIPREISAAAVDRPKMAPGEAASGEASVAAFGAEMEQTSFYGARQELVLQGAQDRVDASYAEAKIQERFEQEAEKYRLGLKGDYRNYAKQAQLDRDAIQKEIQEDPILKNNPRLQSIIAPHFIHYADHFQGVINTKYAVDLQQDGYVKHDHKIKELGQQASMIPAGPGRDAIFKEMDAVSNDFVKSNLLNPVHANLLVENEKKNVQEGYLLNLGKSNNPIDIQKAIDLAESKSSTDTDNIDPKSLAQMAGEFRSHLEVVKNKVDNETAMNTALGLMKNHHGDPSLALTELDSNTDMQKAMGANTYQKTRQVLNDHIEDKDRFEKEEAKKEYKQASQAIIHRKYAEAEKIINNSKYLQGTEEGLTLTNAIRTWRKRTDDDISGHEDRADYVRLNKMIDEGEDPEKIQKEIIKTNHLKSGTAFKLLDRLDKNLETDVKHGITTSNHLLSTLISPAKNLNIPVVPEMTEKIAGAQQELQTWALGENKKAKEGKRTPLTSSEIVEHAKEIAPHYMMTVDQQMKAVNDYMKPDKNKPTPKYSQEDLEYTAKTHNMTVEQVKAKLGIK